ncbi:hypothetical protein VKT23_015001 [Stygiomarasmius scandens]|uniref:BTB domain-containing protein n=1 Tax=Marasmiellus scandens TaxID=2682957 RepID=A0ABR1IZA4_9AGAR
MEMSKFRSSDGVIFNINQKYLEVTTEGFPSSSVNGSTATAVPDEIIPLTESSATLKLLFKFVHPKDQPDLWDLEFSALMDLANAAEKYIVYNAINVCQIRMRDFLPEHVQELFEFGATYNHPSLLAAAAPLLVHKPLEDVIYKLPVDIYRPWSLYRDRVLRACNIIAASAGACCTQSCLIDKYRRLILESPANLFKMERWMSPSRNHDGPNLCTCVNRPCCSEYVEWKTRALAQVRAVPDFKAVLTAYRALSRN